jgi:hypothetical protein
VENKTLNFVAERASTAMPRIRKKKSLSSSNKTPYSKPDSRNAQLKDPFSREERRRRRKASSPLEKLPLEILVQIFILSMEISLPQSSHYIGKALSSEWVINQFISRVQLLQVVEVNRLMNCRFFNLEWWGRNKNGRRFLDSLMKDERDLEDCRDIALRLRIPLKLSRRPWTTEKLAMWNDCTIPFGIVMFDTQDPLATQVALDLLEDAITQCDAMAVHKLLKVEPVNPHRLFVSNESFPCPITHYLCVPHFIVRDAVIKHGCVEHIVVQLLLHGLHWSLRHQKLRTGRSVTLGVNYVDPELWNWAEKNGEKGKWLMAMLRLMNEILLPDSPLDLQNIEDHLTVLWYTRIESQFPHISEDPYFKKLQKTKMSEVGIHWYHCSIHTPQAILEILSE